MPPISQQGSRAALITWVVVLAILFIGATIFAFYFNAEARNATAQIDTFKKKYNDYVNQSTFNEQRINDLKDLRSQDGSGFNKSMTVIDVALQQRDELAQVVTGKPGTPVATAKAEAQNALVRAGDEVKSLGVSVPSTNGLAGAIGTLSHSLAERDGELQSTKKQLEESNKKVEATVASMNEQLAAKDKDIEAANTEKAAAVESVSQREAQKQALIDEEQKGRTGDVTKSQEAYNKVQATVAERSRTVKELKDQLDRIRQRFVKVRVDPNGPVLRQSDGEIVRLAGNDICYINLGAGDQVSAGLTFEVYDKNEGVPALTEKIGGEESMPEGKASIEVTRVGATSSECRIVHLKPGTHLSEGDVIANLIYDPNTKYTFLVYGNFDLDQNNVATAADAEVIKRLITQWGGKLSDKISVDTDFVVLGQEPQIPSFTKEEQEDPVNQQKIAAARADAEAYDKVRAQASELHIPVLNQNRFLYFVGYYDSSKR